VRNLSQTARGMPRERAWPASNIFARGTETIENVRFVICYTSSSYVVFWRELKLSRHVKKGFSCELFHTV